MAKSLYNNFTDFDGTFFRGIINYGVRFHILIVVSPYGKNEFYHILNAVNFQDHHLLF